MANVMLGVLPGVGTLIAATALDIEMLGLLSSQGRAEHAFVAPSKLPTTAVELCQCSLYFEWHAMLDGDMKR